MSLPIFAKTVRDLWRGLAGWSCGVVILLLLEAALWPSVRDMPDLEKLLASYPEAVKELFDLDSMSTGMGFLNAELFTLVLPALFIVFGVSRGARLVAGEEETGTLELILVTPASTTRVLFEKALGLTAGILLLGAACVLGTLAASWLFGLHVPVVDSFIGSLAVTLLGLEFAILALAVGAMTGRRAVALAVGGVAALGAYVLYVAGMLVDELSPWSAWSPFHQALSSGPVAHEVPAGMPWLVVGAALAWAVAAPVFARRDVRHV
ncbi:ABC transporter permease [Nocardioides pyridinolyticus]